MGHPGHSPRLRRRRRDFPPAEMNILYLTRSMLTRAFAEAPLTTVMRLRSTASGGRGSRPRTFTDLLRQPWASRPTNQGRRWPRITHRRMRFESRKKTCGLVVTREVRAETGYRRCNGATSLHDDRVVEQHRGGPGGRAWRNRKVRDGPHRAKKHRRRGCGTPRRRRPRISRRDLMGDGLDAGARCDVFSLSTCG